jgi:hypothetical protein
MRLALVGVALSLAIGQAHAGEIRACVEHVDPIDWAASFERGAVQIPAYTVFAYGGHTFDDLQNPRDYGHWSAATGTWSVSPEEKARRQALISRDAKLGPHDQIALITLQGIRLTQRHPCGTVAAQAVISVTFNWRQTEIPASPQIFYQVYGVVGSNGLNDDLGGDTNSFLFAAARGEISAEVTSTIDSIYQISGSQ